MILLTGATGYLGSQIARELVARKTRFRVLVRDASRLPFDVTQAGGEVVAGDLRNPSTLPKALRGAHVVIHTAALVKMWVRDRRDYWRVNLEGLQNLLQVAVDSGVGRVIYTSSFLALGPSGEADLGEELRYSGPYFNEYVETKAQALAWLREEGFRQFPVLALLPGVIYGPGPKTEGNLLGRMIDQYLAGKFPGVLGAGKQRWSFSFNADVVAAHLTALEKGNVGEEYVLGGDNRSLNDFFRLLGDISGVRHPVSHLPFVAGKMVGVVEVARARLFGHRPQLTPGVVEIFKHDWVYSSGKAVRQLGYHVTPLEEGLRRTLDSLAH
jgi:farnesol dehydrogenase